MNYEITEAWAGYTEQDARASGSSFHHS